MGEKMNDILGTTFEAYLRVLILFEAANQDTLKEETITALDFITVYAKDFDITDFNLHGENKYRFGEYPYRRELVQSAVKRLVMDGLIDVLQTSDGYDYRLNQKGIEFSLNLQSDYADNYYETALQVMEKTKEKSEQELIKMINSSILSSL